jgi:transposase
VRSQSGKNTKKFFDFIGIDASEDTMALFSLSDSSYANIDNNEESLRDALDKFQNKSETLVLIENSGGYENTCIDVLLSLGFKVHRTDNKKVKNFKKLQGEKAKTDKIDSRILAMYGEAYHEKLKFYNPMGAKKSKARQLLWYADSLKAFRASEKNRFQSPGCVMIADSVGETIEFLDRQIKNVEEMMENIIREDEGVKEKIDLLVGYTGIARTTAIKIAYRIPELGKADKRGIASLCRVAPRADDSGKRQGYRTTEDDNGRPEVRTMLFFSVLTAIRHNGEMKEFYERLLANGKKKKVAIIACMRKMIVQLNAILKRGYAVR